MVAIKDIDGYAEPHRQQLAESDLDKRVKNEGQGAAGGSDHELMPHKNYAPNRRNDSYGKSPTRRSRGAAKR